MNKFREAVLYSGLNEVPRPDKQVTWFNNRGDEPIYVRLDRFLVNEEWRKRYPTTSTTTLDFFCSDHRPIVCNMDKERRGNAAKGGSRFHFEDKWLLDKTLVPDFLCEWAALGTVHDIPRKLEKCAVFFKSWARMNCDVKAKDIERMRQQRQKLMLQVRGKGTHEKILEITKDIEKAVEEEAQHWQQRACLNWMTYGDRNTRAFHAQASKRRRKNEILELTDENGEIHRDEKEKVAIITGFFKDLFQTDRPTKEAIEKVVAMVRKMCRTRISIF